MANESRVAVRDFQEMWKPEKTKEADQLLGLCTVVTNNLLYAKAIAEHKRLLFLRQRPEYQDLCERLAFNWRGFEAFGQQAQQAASESFLEYQQTLDTLKAVLERLDDNMPYPLDQLHDIPNVDPLELVVKLLLKAESPSVLTLEFIETLLRKKLPLGTLGVPSCLMLYWFNGKLDVAVTRTRWHHHRLLNQAAKKWHDQRIGENKAVRDELEVLAYPVHRRWAFWNWYHSGEGHSYAALIQKLLQWTLQSDIDAFKARRPRSKWRFEAGSGYTATEIQVINHRDIQAQSYFVSGNSEVNWRRADPCLTCRTIHHYDWLTPVQEPNSDDRAHGPLQCAENLAHVRIVADSNQAPKAFMTTLQQVFDEAGRNKEGI